MRILLLCSWQSYNIGDIAHTPGAWGVLRRHFPEAEVTLWPGPLEHGVNKMLATRCPGMAVLDPSDGAAVDAAIDDADLMLHGPGPNLIRPPDIRRWLDRTDKPFGALGVTLERIEDHRRDLVEGASFIFTRETKSLDVLRASGIAPPVTGFAPDAVAALPIVDEAAGRATLERFGLEPDRFVCAVPRLRYTPYHTFKPGMGWSDERIRHVEDVNDRHTASDHALLVHALRSLLEQTDLQVLLCPEMTYQVPLLESLLREPLPTALRDRVHNLGRYWLPDEAAAVYGHAASVVSMECHSPLIALARGTPCLHLRQPEDTIKGQMYHDLGLGGWLFEIDAADPDALADTLLAQVNDRPAADATMRNAQARVEKSLASAANAIHAVVPHDSH